MKIEAAQRLFGTVTHSGLLALWQDFNATCFDGNLRAPLILLESGRKLSERIEDFIADHSLSHVDKTDDNEPGGLVLWSASTQRAVIIINSGMDLAETKIVLAHEMVHQALAEEHGYIPMCRLGHGPSFLAYKRNIERYPGLYLTDAYGDRV